MITGDLDLEGFMERIEQSEALAPIIDPTLYLQGAERLTMIKDIARAGLEFKRAIHKAMGISEL